MLIVACFRNAGRALHSGLMYPVISPPDDITSFSNQALLVRVLETPAVYMTQRINVDCHRNTLTLVVVILPSIIA